MNRRQKLIYYMSRLRLEEFIALLFLIPSFIITIKANMHFYEAGLHVPRKFYGGITRLVVTSIVMALFFLFVKKKPLWKYTAWLRDVMPFAFCIAIYTNLHDTIHFVNPHDIHYKLIAMDKWLFGEVPVIWAQKFYHPWLTDYFSISYMNYFFIAVAVVVFLMIQKKEFEMRQVLLGTILTFYFGYFLYIVFPAAPPRIVLADQFVRSFEGGWLTATQLKMVRISAASSRAAFPSLHCAVTLISLIYAFKHSKKLFWILLIPGISLVMATIYLRHHYAVDILAGFVLAIGVYFLAPRLDAWWNRFKIKQEQLQRQLTPAQNTYEFE